jgi:hypothetical protein
MVAPVRFPTVSGVIRYVRVVFPFGLFQTAPNEFVLLLRRDATMAQGDRTELG